MRLMKTTSIYRAIIVCVAEIAIMQAREAGAQSYPPSKLTNAADPFQLYGHCRTENSAMKNKWDAIDEIGETERDVLATQVLACRQWTGGSTRKVDCESVGANGVPYAYCIDHPNDGFANEKVMGVLKRDDVTDANGLYTGCPDGASLQPKLDVAVSAGVDPRRVKAIITISCKAATGTNLERATENACPQEPQPYSRCIRSANDGHGNAVTLGIVAATDAGDVYGLYGECDGAQSGILPGFAYKSDVLASVGKVTETTRAADVLYCAEPTAFGSGIPKDLEIFPNCQLNGSFQFLPQALMERYDYCVWGTDKLGNGVLLGVSGK